MLRGVGCGDCPMLRWQSWEVNLLLKALSDQVDHHARQRPGFISQLVNSTYYYLEFDKPWGWVWKVNVALPYLWSSSWWKPINYKIISFGAMGGNCSVQSPCHHCLLLWIPACWGYKNVYQNTYTTMLKQMKKLFFRFLRQTQIVEQSSHTSCRPIFPVDMFASRWCHGITTSPCELRCMAVLTNQKCCWWSQKIRRKRLDKDYR